MTKQQKLILAVSILASFVAFLDGSVMGVALPSVSREFGGGLAVQQWVNDAYLITLGALILAAGSFSDIFGRKKILIIGLYGFLVASLLCAVAQNSESLIIFRALQGVTGALLVPSSLALIIAGFSGTAQSKALGSWTAWTGIAFIIGPLVGGLLVDLASWRYVFTINVLPIVGALLCLRYLKLDDVVVSDKKVDFLGIVLGAVGLGGVVYSLIEQTNLGWGNPLIYGSLIGGIVALLFFVWHEKRTEQPMLSFALFKTRNFSVGNVATFFIYAALSLQGFLLVIFLQQVSGYTAVAAGLASVPVTIILFVLSSKFGSLSGKYGPRAFMTLGPIVSGLGILLMLRVNIPTDYWTQLLPGIIVFGLGLAATVAPLTSAILGSIKSSQAGIGSAINNAVARIAGLLAIAVIGIFIGDEVSQNSFHTGLIVCATLLILGGVVSGFGIQNKLKNKQI